MIVYPDFEEQFGEVSEQRLPGGSVGMYLTRFEEKTRVYRVRQRPAGTRVEVRQVA